MEKKRFPVIDPAATGENIVRLRKERGLTVRDLQRYFGFEEPRAIYKWQSGQTLPSVDNLFALGALLDVPMEQILVPVRSEKHTETAQRVNSRCAVLPVGSFGYDRKSAARRHCSGHDLRAARRNAEQRTRDRECVPGTCVS